MVSSESTTPSWHYDKTEDEPTKSSPTFWSQFDYVLVEPSEESEKILGSWEVVDTVDGFAGLRIVRPSDEAVGAVEEKVIAYVLGDEGVRLFEKARGFVRDVITKGWWVEVRMEPKIRILRRGVEV